MNSENGIFSKLLGWLSLPSNTDTTVKDWMAALALIVIASFLWSTVIKTID